MAQAKDSFNNEVELFEVPTIYRDIDYSENLGTSWYANKDVKHLVMERNPKRDWVLTAVHHEDGSFDRIGKNIKLAAEARKPIVAKNGYAAARDVVGGFVEKVMDRRI